MRWTRRVDARRVVLPALAALAIGSAAIWTAVPISGAVTTEREQDPAPGGGVRAGGRPAGQHRDRVTALLTDLVAVPTPYGTSAAEAQRLLAGLFERAGFSVQVTTDDPAALADHPEFMPPAAWTEHGVNLVAAPPPGRVAPIALFAHIDTERAGQGWTSPPTSAVVRDGRMYGLGTADSKAGVAAAVVAALALAEAGRPAPTVVIIHGKGGGARGSLPVFARLKGPRASVYVHPAETGNGMAEVKHSSRGVLDLVLTVTGWRGRPREAGTPESAPYGEGGDALQACVRLLEAVRAQTPPGAAFNVGRLTAGERPGTVPDRCQAEMRFLFESGTAQAILTQVEAALGEAARRLETPQGRFAWTLAAPGTRSNPAGIDWNAPLSRLVRRSIAEVTGAEPVSYTNHMTSDIRFPIRAAGVPSVGIGSKGGNFSRADEWIDLDDLVRLVDVLMLVAGGAGDLPAPGR